MKKKIKWKKEAKQWMKKKIKWTSIVLVNGKKIKWTSRGNDMRSAAERPRNRNRIDKRRPLRPYCMSEGCELRQQTAAWCRGFCKCHARNRSQ